MEVAPKPKSSTLFDSLGVVAVVLSLVGSLVYAIWAQIGTPAEPAASYIEWQARWGDGRYGMKATFLATWLTLMMPIAVLWAVVWVPTDLMRAKAAPRIVAPTSHDWLRMPATTPTLTVVGVLLFGLSLAGFFVLGTQPETFSFFSVGASVLFLALPIFFLAGLFALLNLVMPSRVTMGPVDELKHRVDEKGQSQGYAIKVGAQYWDVPKEAWEKMHIGQVVYLRAPSLSDAVRDLRLQVGVHYR